MEMSKRIHSVIWQNDHVSITFCVMYNNHIIRKRCNDLIRQQPIKMLFYTDRVFPVSLFKNLANHSYIAAVLHST